MLQTNIEELQLQHEQDEEQKSHYERCVEKK